MLDCYYHPRMTLLKKKKKRLSGRNKAVALTICHLQTITNSLQSNTTILGITQAKAFLALFFSIHSYGLHFFEPALNEIEFRDLFVEPSMHCTDDQYWHRQETPCVLRIRAVVLSDDDHFLFSDSATQYYPATQRNTYYRLY